MGFKDHWGGGRCRVDEGKNRFDGAVMKIRCWYVVKFKKNYTGMCEDPERGF